MKANNLLLTYARAIKGQIQKFVIFSDNYLSSLVVDFILVEFIVQELYQNSLKTLY